MFMSCETDGWEPMPPQVNSWDARLTGYWELVQINGSQISGEDVNFMFFNGTGRGVYYYYLNGDHYSETLSYQCQNAVGGSSRTQVNIQYENAVSPTTMNYWFGNSGSTLYLQWTNQTGLQTYTYTKYPSAPW